MKFFKILIILTLPFLLVACNSEKKKLLQKIQQTEAKGKQDAETAVAKAQLYEEYAEKFKDDTLSPLYLYKAAELHQFAANNARCIELLDALLNRYPNHRDVPEALFYKGYVYETQLMDYPHAKKAFEELIKRFPNHPRAAVARTNLPYIGTLPEWTKELEGGGVEPADSIPDTPAN